MNINSMKQSRFLTKTDVGNGILVTIKSLHQEDLAMEGEPEQLEWCVNFSETEKPMVLKSVNAQLIAAALHSQETDDWIGKQIVLYTDPTVTMKGKVVGGIRCRAPRNQPARPATPTERRQTSTHARSREPT